MAIEVIRPESREHWLAARRKDVTASVAGALLGVHPYADKLRLWGEKTGRIDSGLEDNPILRRGRLFEPIAVQIMREDRPYWRIDYDQSNTYFRDPDLRLGATPDCFCRRPDIPGTGIIQIKTIQESDFRRRWIEPDTREIVPPVWIAVQALLEMRLTGVDWAAVAALVYGYGVRVEIVEIPRHDRLFKRLVDAAADFWRVVDSGAHPPDDWAGSIESVLDTWAESDGSIVDLPDDPDLLNLCDRWAETSGQISRLKDERDAMKAQMIRALGNHEAGRIGPYRISAKTQYRPAHEVGESRTRSVRVIKKEHTDHGKF